MGQTDNTPPFLDQRKLLLIEDDIDTADLMRETLQDHVGPDRIMHVATLAEARAVDLDDVMLVLSDMNLPDGYGLDLLPEFLAQRPDLPVVFVTAEGIMERAIEAVNQGAYDYVVKAGDYLFALPVMVEKNLMLYRIKQENERLMREVSEKNDQLEEMVRQLEEVAATDPLTGLANRRAFNRAMDERFAEAVRYGRPLSLLLMDLDGFKPLNDTLGHQEGDRLLQTVADVLRANCRTSDVAGRFGGDEFVLLLNQTEIPEARQAAERIAQQLTEAARAMLAEFDYDGCVSMSIGVTSLAQGKPSSPEQMLGQADRAMYEAKARPERGVAVYLPGDQPQTHAA